MNTKRNVSLDRLKNGSNAHSNIVTGDVWGPCQMDHE